MKSTSARNRRSCITPPALCLVLTITVFSVRMRFSSVQKTRLARAARNGRSAHTTLLETPYIEAFKRGGPGVHLQWMRALGLRGNADDAGRQNKVPEPEAQAPSDQ